MRKIRKIPKQNLTRDWYLDSVYNDPEFMNDTERLNVDRLKVKYRLTDEEIMFYKSGYFSRGRFINRRKSLGLHTDNENNEVVVRVGRDATLSDFKQAWPLIKAIRWSMYGQEESRNKPPENPSIVYGAFKLWIQNRSRTEIFKAYETGDLSKEKYNTKAFITSKELMDYCRPYFKVIEQHAKNTKSE